MQTLTSPALSVPFGGLLRQILRNHIWFIGGVLLYLLAGQIIPRLFGLQEHMRVSLYQEVMLTLLFFFLLGFVLGHLLYLMIIKRPARLIETIYLDYRDRYLAPERLAGGVLMICLLPVFFSIFTSFKVMIPQINPFSWDETFRQWDLALHDDVAPWQLLQPLIGIPAVTEVISFSYQLWFFVLYGMMFWQAFSVGDPRLRMQFFLTNILIWSLLGNFLATVLSSAGPCYYPLVTAAADPFVPLFEYLRQVSETHYLPQLNIQEMLWNGYQAGGVQQARGISAMPSMHVSSAFLFVLVGWRVNRALGWLLTGFFTVILIGSVHLGWHYAVDGYVSIPLTWLLWHFAGRLLDLDPFYRNNRSRSLAQAA